MKIQDILFIATLAVLLYKQKPIWFVWVGILCLIVSVPLFSVWVFFTAQRLTYYAAGFFLAAAVLYLANKDKH